MRVSEISCAAADDLTRGRVKGYVFICQSGFHLGGSRAAGERAQPGEQFLERERLDQIVVGAGVQPDDAVTDRRPVR